VSRARNKVVGTCASNVPVVQPPSGKAIQGVKSFPLNTSDGSDFATGRNYTVTLTVTDHAGTQQNQAAINLNVAGSAKGDLTVTPREHILGGGRWGWGYPLKRTLVVDAQQRVAQNVSMEPADSQ